MKVQLSGKEYVSNLESLGFKPMLSHIFFINYLRQMGVEGAHMEEGCGGGHTMLPHTFFINYLCQMGVEGAHVEEGWGGGMWRRAADRVGADHHANGVRAI
jgi:hypothetical protein